MNHMTKQEACLIHCKQGTNRSIAIALAIKFQQQAQRKRRDHATGHAQNQSGIHVEECENMLYHAWFTTCQAAGKLVLTNVGFQRQLYLWARLLCFQEKHTSWPRSWGPELWLPCHPLNASLVQELRRFRDNYEERLLEQGGTPKTAFVDAATETANHMMELNLRVLRMKSAGPHKQKACEETHREVDIGTS